MHLMLHCRVSVVYPCDHMADGAVAHRPYPTSQDHISLAGKRSKFRIWIIISTECILLLHNCQAEKSLSLSIVSQGPSVFFF